MSAKLKPQNYHLLLERTRQDAESVARVYSADRVLVENLSAHAFATYFSMIFDAIDFDSGDGETGKSICDYYKEECDGELNSSYATELVEKGLISGVNENGFCQVLNWDCRQKKSDTSKERTRKYLERQFNQLVTELIAGREKPAGLPDSAVVWGANNKRWGSETDVRFAEKMAKRIKQYKPDYVLGITDVDCVRHITRETGIDCERPHKAFRVLKEIAEKNVNQLTMNKIRREVKRKYVDKY